MQPAIPAETPETNRQKWLKRLTFAALMAGVGLQVIFPLLNPWRSPDFDNIMAAGVGDFSQYYYAPWLVPFLSLVHLLPYTAARLVVNVVSTAGFWLALKVFGGNRILLFLSFPLIFGLIYGQLFEGICIGGLALMVLALRRENSPAAAAAWTIASTKFYIGLPLGLAVLWCIPASNQTKIRVLLITALLWAISPVLFPGWIDRLLVTSAATPPIRQLSIETWKFVGPFALLLWIPVLVTFSKDLRWWAATWVLTVPYLQIYNLVHFLVFPVGPVGWIVQLGYLTGIDNAFFLLIPPAYIYVQTLWRVWNERRSPVPVEKISGDSLTTESPV